MLIKQLLHLSPRTRCHYDCRRIKFPGRISGADIVLIAKDTLSLSNSKLMLIAVAGELNSRAGSAQQMS